MTTQDISNESPTTVLIGIDTKGQRCSYRTVRTRISPKDDYKEFGPLDMYRALTQIVSGDERLRERVEVEQVGCMWGCTYGPRVDVTVNSQDGSQTFLYGNRDCEGEISVRGRVSIIGIPQLDSLQNMIYDHLSL